MREEEQGGRSKTNDTETTGITSETVSSKDNNKRRRRRPIQQVEYDSLYRPLDRGAGDDGKWQASNPVDPTTGLWYDPESYTSSSKNADWADLIPTFLQHGYESSLGLENLQNNPLLLIERSYNPPPLRQQLLEILMEECEVPALFLGRDATMACYGCGRTTSTVVDIGYSGTTVTPVYEGYVEQKGIRRSPIGTMAMDELGLQHLQKAVETEFGSSRQLLPLYQVRNKGQKFNRNPAFHRLALLDIAKDCRELGAGQSINTAASKTLQVPSMSFTLPDGETVDIPSANRFDVADLVMGGRPITAASDNNSNEQSDLNKPREDALQALTKKYNSILTTATAEDKDDDDADDDGDHDGDESMEDASGDEMDADEKKKQASKYTDATAVGVTSRRTTRAGKAAATAAKSTQAAKKQGNQQRKVYFNNPILQKACASYLQAQLEQQLTAAPVASMVCDAAFRCDRDQQASVLGNVVLCGGGACIGPTDQAVPDLLREQMEAIIHTHTPGWRVKVLSPGMKQERAICSWLGGSILASLGTFHDMWITKAEYEEWGSAIVNRKCP